MRRLALVSGAALLVACGGSETPAADSAATAAPPPPAALSLADVAGTWTVVGKNEAGDSTLVTYELTATADTSGWSLVFPNRPPVPLRVVAVAGDSIVVEAGPYESVLRKGVQVNTRSVSRIVDGKMVGRSVAHYSKGPDSVRVVVTEGTRKP
jgi:hypothetical protein